MTKNQRSVLVKRAMRWARKQLISGRYRASLIREARILGFPRCVILEAVFNLGVFARKYKGAYWYDKINPHRIPW